MMPFAAALQFDVQKGGRFQNLVEALLDDGPPLRTQGADLKHRFDHTALGSAFARSYANGLAQPSVDLFADAG